MASCLPPPKAWLLSGTFLSTLVDFTSLQILVTDAEMLMHY